MTKTFVYDIIYTMNLRMDSSHNKGFTLIEVMVAMLILVSCIVTLSTSWSGNYFRLNKSEMNHNIAELLQRKITEIEIENLGKSIDEIKDSDSGTFKGFPKYRWEMEAQEFEMPDMSAILSSQSGGADEMLITIINQMTEHITKSVKEIKISVFIKYKKKELKHSVTTYFVDYDQELSLNGLGAMGGLGGGGGEEQ